MFDDDTIGGGSPSVIEHSINYRLSIYGAGVTPSKEIDWLDMDDNRFQTLEQPGVEESGPCMCRKINCESVVQNQRPGKITEAMKGRKNACNIADGKKNPSLTPPNFERNEQFMVFTPIQTNKRGKEKNTLKYRKKQK